MEPTLVAVTVMSLAMAVAMGAVAWRLLREERRRSDARVAALAGMAADEQSRNARGMPTEGPAWDSLPLRALESDAGAPAPVASHGLFAAPLPPSRLGTRVIALVAAALVMAAGVWGVWRFGPRTGGGAAAAGAAPIELLSLAHDREGDALRITGMVQNPTNGLEQRNVVAVAFLFDRSGRVVGSGTAPLDATRLAPGDASPFVIVVEHAENVARYRLGFRAQDGRVLAHVDRRTYGMTTE
jgi:hypothetical protein